MLKRSLISTTEYNIKNLIYLNTLNKGYLKYHRSGLPIPPITRKTENKSINMEIHPEETILTDKERLRQDIESQRSQSWSGISWKDFSELTKFKLSLMNTTVAATAYFMMEKCVVTDFFQISLFLAATQAIAMSSQAMNQAIEFEHDKKMKRTQARPVPLGKITPNHAKMISLALLGLSNAMLIPTFDPSTAIIANSIFASYIFVYTPLKRLSTWNTHWGSAVGAAVPFLGWAAAGGSVLSIPPMMMALFMFAWQYPHFYGILWTYKDDYKNGGYKMIEDPNLATKHVKAAFVGYIVSMLGMIYGGLINPYLALATAPYLYKYGWTPGVAFGQNPTVEMAQKMKKGSYIPFTIFFALVLLGLAEKTYLRTFHMGIDTFDTQKKTEQKKEEKTNISPKAK
jgi:protoheme IX farnesyltransferase